MPCKQVTVSPPQEEYKIAAVRLPQTVNQGESFDIEVEVSCTGDGGCEDVPYELTVAGETVVGPKQVTMQSGHTATGPFSIEGVSVTEPGMAEVMAEFGGERQVVNLPVQESDMSDVPEGDEIIDTIKDNKGAVLAGAAALSAILGGS